MKVFILAGGLGTRLREIVGDCPKPMAPIFDKPFLAYIIELLREQSFNHFVLCISHKADQFQEHFGTGERYGVTIDYVVESVPLGTGGALRNAQDFIDSSFLLLNGDTYLNADFNALVACHQHRRDTVIGTIGVQAADDTVGRGVVTIDSNGLVQSFQEKVEVAPGWINAGVYVLQPEILDFIPAQSKLSIERDVFPAILDHQRQLQSFETTGFFVDIGTPQGYYQFQSYIEGTGYDYSK
jgi:mannose-1-phosphate guanylyltransferase